MSTEPIISPWIIYWIGVIDSAKLFLALGILVLFALSSVYYVLYYVEMPYLDFRDEEERNPTRLKKGKRFLLIACITLTVSCLIPSKQDIYLMVALNNITPANIESVGGSLDQAIDVIIDKIIKAQETIKQD